MFKFFKQHIIVSIFAFFSFSKYGNKTYIIHLSLGEMPSSISQFQSQYGKTIT